MDIYLAQFALAVRKRQIIDFEVPHLPNEILSMRIGLHTGSVVSSVVGHIMPKWCLFGEAVQVVANCESHGVANQIHLSEAMFDALEAEHKSDGTSAFSLGSERFHMRRRDASIGDENTRRKTVQAYNAVGNTYFLLKDNFGHRNIQSRV